MNGQARHKIEGDRLGDDLKTYFTSLWMMMPSAYFCLRSMLILFSLVVAGCLNGVEEAVAKEIREPRIVNIYNFIRNSDFRMADSEDVLFDCTRHQIELLKDAKLPATWAIQYDALINPRYQKLLKEELGTNDEIAAWWEIPQPLAEKAGLKWRGQHVWDPAANVGFSPGYTPEERKKLVDVYMAEFKRVFGYYPKTVGSWYIDEVTLDYMARKYGIIASCNCKDQIGTDFYTLWGGYWNQAYYPSRLNAYMPAQTRHGQIPVPIFRMLGSDPIYQHGITPGMFTMEPVYPDAGGSSNWVGWFIGNFVSQPSLAFAYTQVGQENSFGWEAMQKGLQQQVALLKTLADSSEIRVEPLAQSGEWFRKHFSVTPPTAVVALDDWKHQGRKTVWYDSRFYRVNLLWQDGAFFIRDLHCFDENLVSPTHEKALTATSLSYETLPIMDWARWSTPTSPNVGMWPVLLSSNNLESVMLPEGDPVIKSMDTKKLEIKQPLSGGGQFLMICAEDKITCTASDAWGKPLCWTWSLNGGSRQKSIVQSVTPSAVNYLYCGTGYQLRLARGSGSCEQLNDGNIQIKANQAGAVVLLLSDVGK
jgi:hypothetical protein